MRLNVPACVICEFGARPKLYASTNRNGQNLFNTEWNCHLHSDAVYRNFLFFYFLVWCSESVVPTCNGITETQTVLISLSSFLLYLYEVSVCWRTNGCVRSAYKTMLATDPSLDNLFQCRGAAKQPKDEIKKCIMLTCKIKSREERYKFN